MTTTGVGSGRIWTNSVASETSLLGGSGVGENPGKTQVGKSSSSPPLLLACISVIPHRERDKTIPTQRLLRKNLKKVLYLSLGI